MEACADPGSPVRTGLTTLSAGNVTKFALPALAGWSTRKAVVSRQFWRRKAFLNRQNTRLEMGLALVGVEHFRIRLNPDKATRVS